MKIKSENYVSVIAASLIRPILTLVETLEAQKPVVPNEVQTGLRENGYSCAITALTVFLLESALNRTRYVRRDKAERDATKYFAKISEEWELTADVEELFAARDAIVHNHLWKARTFNDNQGRKGFAAPPQLISGYGSARFRRVVNPANRLSRRLGLNLFPARIWRRDAYITLKTAGRVLKKLESMKREYFSVSDEQFEFRGQDLTLHEILDNLAIPPESCSLSTLKQKRKENRT